MSFASQICLHTLMYLSPHALQRWRLYCCLQNYYIWEWSGATKRQSLHPTLNKEKEDFLHVSSCVLIRVINLIQTYTSKFVLNGSLTVIHLIAFHQDSPQYPGWIHCTNSWKREISYTVLIKPWIHHLKLLPIWFN